jgi:CubicO group peptidase (beta-lactamase class C family)
MAKQNFVHGYVHPDFRTVGKVFAKQIPRSRPGGAAVCVYHRGEIVVDLWGGTRDEAGTRWEPDTLALSYSTSKGVVATLLHILVDRGLIDYDDPVGKLWPEFANSGKERITVRHILCHEAGLYGIRSMVDSGVRMLDWEYMTEALADSLPEHEPGAAHGYHALTWGWLVGELIQRATGKSFREALASELAEPLGLDGLYIGLPEHEMQRRAHTILPGLQRWAPAQHHVEKLAAPLHRALKLTRAVDLGQLASALVPRGVEDVDFNSREFLSVPIPAANGTFSARSLAKLYALLANDGELHGVRLLSPETVRRASEVQNRGIGRVIPFPMHWRLGYHRVPTIRTSVRAGFGHFGFGGSGAWADPERNLSVALVVNSGTGTPFGDLRMVRLGSTAARCAERR